MSTRSAIARALPDGGWRGVFCHWDGYPTHQGPIIWRVLHTEFVLDGQVNVDLALRFWVDAHASGWSSLQGAADHALSPTCHGCIEPMTEPMELFEHGPCSRETCDPLFIEWVYALAPRHLIVMAAGKFAVGPGGSYHHFTVGMFPYTDPEPDWEALERDASARYDEATGFTRMEVTAP